MTGGPTPVAGTNPYLLAYQTRQFSTRIPPGISVLDALVTPPSAGIAAETSPDKLFRENTNPPLGAGGNENNSGFPGS